MREAAPNPIRSKPGLDPNVTVANVAYSDPGMRER